jgi:hypothetical protein
MMQREKGADWERQVVKLFQAAGFDAKRRAQLQAGAEKKQPDVLADPFWLECKARKRNARPVAALEQGAEACPGGRVPVAVCKVNYRRPTVTLYLDDFLDLAREWRERGE